MIGDPLSPETLVMELAAPCIWQPHNELNHDTTLQVTVPHGSESDEPRLAHTA